MRKNMTLVRENLKKQRGSFIGIFLLMFIITISLSCVLCIWSNSESYVRSEMERVRFGDIIYWLKQTEQIDTITEAIEAVEGVQSTGYEKSINMKVIVNGIESSYVSAYVCDETTPYKMFDGDGIKYAEQVEPLKKGEAYVPISYQSLAKAKIGDRILIKDGTQNFIVKGFFEDPTSGSTTMGTKNILISEADMEEMWEYNEQKLSEEMNDGMLNVYAVRVFLSPDTGLSVKDVQCKIGESVRFENTLNAAYTKEAFTQFMLLLENIFVGLLLAFVAVLLVVALIVIGHCISSSMEQSYVDIGILKAIGYTNQSLRAVQCMQYLIVLGLGLLAGLPASLLLVRTINSMIVPVTGIRIPDKMPLALFAGYYGFIFLILTLFIIFKANRIGRISPMTAIRGGRAEIYFSSRFQTEIYEKGMQFWLALRQLTSGMKSYIGACMIAALLVFALSFSMRIHGWLGEDGAGLMNSMGVASVNGRTYDFAIKYMDEELREEVEALIERRTPIQEVYQTKVLSAQVEGTNCLLNVVSEPEYLHVLEGRTCKYDNEIVITKMVASDFGLQIGDKLSLTVEEAKRDFIVTGLNQCANDMGNNVSISIEGMKYLGLEDMTYYYNYQIEDPEQEDLILSELEDRYGKKIDVDANTWSGVAGIVGAANALKNLMYGICTIFILVVVSMTGSKILYKEQHDLGIYKALGFPSGYLRLSFAIRFVIVALIGSVFGVTMSVGLTDPIAGKMFYLMGVGEFETPIGLPKMITSMLFVVMTFFIFSYGVAGRIKKTDPGILITE